jgi:hypothetical protein
LPNNVDGGLDNAGDREPYVELYNAGPTAVDLSAFFLTDTYANLTRWQFPAGTSLAAGRFLTVWADGEAGESTAAALHTSFRLNPTNGSVALVRLQGAVNTPAVLDYADYANQFPNRGIGLIPDGDVRGRRQVYFPTAGASNNPAVPSVNVVINEFMAQNTTTLADPADGDFDDWIELHNAGSTTVDLTGFFLTDNLTNKTMFAIPSGYPIPAGGFLLVWADGETGQNRATNVHLHASFALARAGEVGRAARRLASDDDAAPRGMATLLGLQALGFDFLPAGLDDLAGLGLFLQLLPRRHRAAPEPGMEVGVGSGAR